MAQTSRPTLLTLCRLLLFPQMSQHGFLWLVLLSEATPWLQPQRSITADQWLRLTPTDGSCLSRAARATRRPLTHKGQGRLLGGTGTEAFSLLRLCLQEVTCDHSRRLERFQWVSRDHNCL